MGVDGAGGEHQIPHLLGRQLGRGERELGRTRERVAEDFQPAFFEGGIRASRSTQGIPDRPVRSAEDKVPDSPTKRAKTDAVLAGHALHRPIHGGGCLQIGQTLPAIEGRHVAIGSRFRSGV